MVSSLQGVGIEGFHCGVLTSGGWNRGGSTVYRGVLTSGGCNRGVPLYTEVSYHIREVESIFNWNSLS